VVAPTCIRPQGAEGMKVRRAVVTLHPSAVALLRNLFKTGMKHMVFQPRAIDRSTLGPLTVSRLETRSGELVTEVAHPPFHPPAGAMQWGSRFFMKSDHEEVEADGRQVYVYREDLLYVVLPDEALGGVTART
jgi:hypothetical protein